MVRTIGGGAWKMHLLKYLSIYWGGKSKLTIEPAKRANARKLTLK